MRHRLIFSACFWLVLCSCLRAAAPTFTSTQTPCVNINVTVTSQITGVAPADQCDGVNSFFVTTAVGGIDLITGGSPTFSSPGGSESTVYNPGSTKVPGLNAIASQCCDGKTVAWAVGDNQTVLYDNGNGAWQVVSCDV